MRSVCNPARCKNINNLGATLDAWEDLVRQCATGGGEFVLNNHQKQMALNQLVPEEIETIYETDKKYGPYEDKLEYARWRSVNAQNKNLGDALTNKLTQVSSIEEDSPGAIPANSPTSSDKSWIECDHAGMVWSCTEDINGDICYTSQKGKSKGKGKGQWNKSPWSKGQWNKGAGKDGKGTR